MGTCYSLDELRELSAFCRSQGLRLYLDGARLANAAVHLGCSLADLAANVDVLQLWRDEERCGRCGGRRRDGSVDHCRGAVFA